MFPVLLDIASRMSSELWDIDSTRIISPKKLKLASVMLSKTLLEQAS
jgi:hypothetical protein